MKVNVIHVLELNQAKKLKYLAVFLKMKALYSNSCIYDFRSAKCEKLNLSRPTLRKYVNCFIQLGWCRVHEGNLIFNKIETVGRAREG